MALQEKNGYGIIVGSIYYHLQHYLVGSGNTVYMYTYNNSTSTISFSGSGATNSTVPDDNSLRGMAYDNVDLFYFVLKDKSDALNYLWTYSISGDSFTKIGRYDVALMLNRNTASSVLEKGFHLTEPKIYQIASNYEWLYHIATLTTTKTIKAITDNYVFLE